MNDLKREVEMLRKKLKTMNKQIENREEASNQEIKERKEKRREAKDISV